MFRKHSKVWKAIWVFIQHFPISGIISRYRELEFPISGNLFPISGKDRSPDIGKWFSDIGNWFSDIGKCAWFPDIEKSIPDIRKSPPDRSRSLRHPATPPYHTAPYQQWPPAILAHLLVESAITTSVNRSVQPTMIIQPMNSLKNTEICGTELMSLMILTRTERWDNYMYHYITICIFVEHFDMPFKNRDNNYDKTYQSHGTWNPLK